MIDVTLATKTNFVYEETKQKLEIGKRSLEFLEITNGSCIFRYEDRA